ncbi:MAG: dihydroorotate dehydrogenase electron transfer subunit [Hydrogenibacillus sp.]|nr:dihydroorotate dehydrogenase electron transfer subunit [Hydrogenibacillus sp.]
MDEADRAVKGEGESMNAMNPPERSDTASAAPSCVPDAPRMLTTTVVGMARHAPTIVELVLAHPAMPDLQPGQFVHLRVPEGEAFLRRPLSVADYDDGTHTLRLIFRTVGVGTKRLSAVRPGDRLDVFFPPSGGFPMDIVPSGGRAVIVGGGLGVAPLLYLAKALNLRGVRVRARIGFAAVEEVYGLERLSAHAEVELWTDDGSAGRRGRVTDGLSPEEPFQALYACGPEPMFVALKARFRHDGRPMFAALEARMACAVGVCRACVVPVRADGGIVHRRVCRDGPVFPLQSLVFPGEEEWA